MEVTEHAWSAVSVVAAAASFCLLIYGTQTRLPLLSVALAAGAVVIGVWRGGQMLKDASAYRQARVQAHRDELTGVANRRALTAELGHGDVPPGVLLLVDVDGFKQINDSLGHAAGDQVLRAVALRIRDAVGPTDMVARIGGDEFVVFRSASDEPPAATAERLRDVSAKPLAVSGLGIRVDISVGSPSPLVMGGPWKPCSRPPTPRCTTPNDQDRLLRLPAGWEADGSDQLRCIQDPACGARRRSPRLCVSTEDRSSLRAGRGRQKHSFDGTIPNSETFLPPGSFRWSNARR